MLNSNSAGTYMETTRHKLNNDKSVSDEQFQDRYFGDCIERTRFILNSQGVLHHIFFQIG